MSKKTYLLLSMVGLFLVPTLLSAATGYLEVSWADFKSGNQYGSMPPKYHAVTTAYCVAALHFPVQSGTVTSMRVRYKDESASHEMSVGLWRITNTDSSGSRAAVFEVATGVSSSSAAIKIKDDTTAAVGTDTINPNLYSWYVLLNGTYDGASEYEKFYSVVITYTY